MDEPTSALSEAEIDELFTIIHALRDHGVAIIYISHRLDELKHIVDRISIFRDGRSGSALTIMPPLIWMKSLTGLVGPKARETNFHRRLTFQPRRNYSKFAISCGRESFTISPSIFIEGKSSVLPA